MLFPLYLIPSPNLPPQLAALCWFKPTLTAASLGTYWKIWIDSELIWNIFESNLVVSQRKTYLRPLEIRWNESTRYWSWRGKQNCKIHRSGIVCTATPSMSLLWRVVKSVVKSVDFICPYPLWGTQRILRMLALSIDLSSCLVDIIWFILVLWIVRMWQYDAVWCSMWHMWHIKIRVTLKMNVE